jgi:hypothetical protein
MRVSAEGCVSFKRGYANNMQHSPMLAALWELLQTSVRSLVVFGYNALRIRSQTHLFVLPLISTRCSLEAYTGSEAMAKERLHNRACASLLFYCIAKY